MTDCDLPRLFAGGDLAGIAYCVTGDVTQKIGRLPGECHR